MPARLAGRRHHPLAGRTILDVTPIPVLFSKPTVVVISAGLSQACRLLGGTIGPHLPRGPASRVQPGGIKVAMEFRLERTPAGTRLSTETRILETDWRRRAWARPRPLSWYMVLSQTRLNFPSRRRSIHSWDSARSSGQHPPHPDPKEGANGVFQTWGGGNIPTVHSGRITCAGDVAAVVCDGHRRCSQSFESGAHLSSGMCELSS